MPSAGTGTIGRKRMRGYHTGEHLVFRWSPTGYTLDVRPGEPPQQGNAVDAQDRRYRVAKVAPSPLPGDTRWCAYLLPDGTEADASHASAEAETAVVEPDVAWTVPRDDLSVLLEGYPGGVCVVAVDAAGRRLSLTVGSLVSLSLDPPLVGFSVPSDSVIPQLLPDAGGCAISILAGGQEWLAEHFAGGALPIAMWHGLASELGAVGAPLFVGALGWLECSLLDSVEVGSDTFFVCDVRRLEAGSEAPALVRVRGGYGSV
jgi:flavin reductase (DIM6/NTAB) family NADH-FMN oxidoreductase RutF